MKRVLFVIGLVLLSVIGFGQGDRLRPQFSYYGFDIEYFYAPPSNYVNVLNRYRWIAGMFDSTFHVPSGATASLRTGGWTGAGALFYRTSDTTLLAYTGFQWRTVGAGSVTSISQAYGAAFSVTPITSTGSIGVDTSLMATRARNTKVSDSMAIKHSFYYNDGTLDEDRTVDLNNKSILFYNTPTNSYFGLNQNGPGIFSGLFRTSNASNNYTTTNFGGKTGSYYAASSIRTQDSLSYITYDHHSSKGEESNIWWLVNGPGASPRKSELYLYIDSIFFEPGMAAINIDSLRMINTDTAGYKPMVWNIYNGQVRYFNSWGELGLGGGGGSGTVNTGAAGKPAYYPSSGTTVDDFAPIDLAISGNLWKITSQNATDIPVTITNHASQSGNSFVIEESGGTDKLVYTSAGKLQLNGIASNTEAIEINSNGSMQLIIQNQGGSQWLYYSDADATSGQNFYTATTAPLVFTINAVEAARFAGSTGNLQLEKKISEYNNSTPADGELLIGHTANGTFEKATLTAGTGISITNGAGAVTITNSRTGFTTATATTTNATITTIETISMGAGANEIAVIEVTLVGISSAGDKRITGKKIVRADHNAGTLTVGSITSILADELTGFTTATWTITSSGNNLLIRVTGEASTTVDWKISYVFVSQLDQT